MPECTRSGSSSWLSPLYTRSPHSIDAVLRLPGTMPRVHAPRRWRLHTGQGGTSLSAPRVVMPERARGPPRRRGGYRNYVDEGGGAEVLAAERWARCAESGRESRSRWDAATAASAEALPPRSGTRCSWLPASAREDTYSTVLDRSCTPCAPVARIHTAACSESSAKHRLPCPAVGRIQHGACRVGSRCGVHRQRLSAQPTPVVPLQSTAGRH